jgi:hypothetical protein
VKKIKLSHIGPGPIALIIAMAGFSGYASLDAPTKTGSATPGKSSQQLLYQQPVERGNLLGPANQVSLGGASDPNWGPIPLSIRW